MSQGPSWTEVISAKAAVASAWAASLSFLSAVVTSIVAWRIGKRQTRLQEQQLKQDLFDRRFAVYSFIPNFVGYVLATEEAISFLSLEVRGFQDLRNQAEWLFEDDVKQYLDDIWTLAINKIYAACQKRRAIQIQNGDANSLIDDICEMETALDELGKQRRAIFADYLKLW